ncbi:hypothetical protein SAMN05444274_10290 [Mariniphaga anaerophila]|uniref:Uncharacterized protein n=1 Tax=Mariniphaga anaerophila TaxID=1484053 RepID=A0A1M4VG92_9BACT|nr:DUF6340 family protein [Mariniphaga anaerophila]SHE67922.1 hypothetical protein SAMN05444274_10290 [Mariniphaga anaerophila]
MKNTFKNIAKPGLLLLVTLFAISCISTRTLVMDIPQPATSELPQSIQSVTLVSQAVDGRFTNLEEDSLQKIFYKQRFNLDTVIYDFQVADTTVKALGELLFESGRYDYVVPEKRFLEAPRTSFLATEIPWEKVEALCDTFQTDAVISLDYLKTRVITDYDNETFFDPFEGGFSSASRAEMKISYEALFRAYDPAQRKILFREFITDTLYWDDADVSTRNLFNRFTTVKQALNETGIVIALELSDRIAVRWRPERRTYFIKGNSDFRKATQVADSGNWQSAVEKWKEVASNAGSKTLKSKAQLNIALGYEILGDIDSAIQWALKSYETMYRPLTYDYLETLKRRKKEQKNTE